MTLTTGQAGPGQETAPAFVVEPQTLHEVELTWRDALVWEQLPREIVGWEKFRLIAIFAAFGMFVALTEDHHPAWFANASGLTQMLLAVAVAYLVHTLLMNLRRSWSARRRVPTPMRVTTEVQLDRVQQSWATGGIAQTLAETRQTICTPSHLFLDSAQSLVILPLGCFDSPKAMAEFAESWEFASRSLSERQDMELPARP